MEVLVSAAHVTNTHSTLIPEGKVMDHRCIFVTSAAFEMSARM